MHLNVLQAGGSGGGSGVCVCRGGGGSLLHC